jgi:hypothetical protein
MKNLLLLFLIFSSTCLSAQSLVPNGGFEEYPPIFTCPVGYGQIAQAIGWSTTANVDSTGSTPDLFSYCANNDMNLIGSGIPINEYGTQEAHYGAYYAGILLDHDDIQQSREYVQVKLNPGIIAGACYHFEMYLSVAERYSRYSTDAIGVYFSEDSITGYNNYEPIPFTPQINNTLGNFPDTSSWTLVSMDYTASGTERFMIIGNFDEFSTSDLITVNPGSIYPLCYVYVDDISLTECATTGNAALATKQVKLFPNPIQSELTITAFDQEPMEVCFYDHSNKLIKHLTVNNTSTIRMDEFATGLYFYTCISKSNPIIHGRVFKN